MVARNVMEIGNGPGNGCYCLSSPKMNSGKVKQGSCSGWVGPTQWLVLPKTMQIQKN